MINESNMMTIWMESGALDFPVLLSQLGTKLPLIHLQRKQLKKIRNTAFCYV